MTPESIVDDLSKPLLRIEDFVESQYAAALTEVAATKGRIPKEDLTIIMNAVHRCRSVTTVEIGLASGSSAVAIMAAKPAQERGRHIAIDPYQTAWFSNEGVDFIDSVGLTPFFELIQKSSHLALPELILQRELKVDFVYIDGNHKFDYTLLEWFYADQMLKIGGVVAFDDCQWAMVQGVASFIEANCSYKFLKQNERTWLAVKLSNDKRKWYDYKPFIVPWGAYYDTMLQDVRRKVQKS
jgi:predicted O-methyltransferase YrrM